MKEYRIYRPNKQGNGTASKVSMRTNKETRYNDKYLFWEIAPQTGVDENKNASFDWRTKDKKDTKSIVVKIGLPDCGEMLAVLKGRAESVDLFHQNQHGNSVIKFGWNNKKLGIQISSKKGDAEPNRLQHGISIGEAAILEVFFEYYVVYHHQE